MLETHLKPAPEILLEEIFEAMNNRGRKLIIEKYCKELSVEAAGLTLAKLEVTIEMPEKSETKIVKVFEGFHLRDFATFIAPPGTELDSNAGMPTRSNLETKLSELLGKPGRKPKKYRYIQDFALATSVSVNSPKLIFQALAAVQENISVTHYLLQFLEFCYERHLPLRMFEERETLEKYIKNLKKYVKKDQNVTEEIVEKPLENGVATPALDNQFHIGSTKPQPKKLSTKTERYTTVTSEDNWLSPRNETFIPFVGRDDEITELDAFADYDVDNPGDFKLWAMVGPSGAGKTRLLTHWANRAIYHDWVAIDINSNTTINWANWSPECPTLISIDYIYGYDKVISDIIARAENTNFDYPVRLLLLDHATPDSMADLLKDPRWGFEGKKAEDFASMEERIFFKNTPLKLQVEEADATFLAKIICAVAYREDDDPFGKIDEPVIQNGLNYLKETKGALQPLFAALVGDAIRHDRKEGENSEAYLTLNRRALIEHYLQGKTRLTWLMKGSDRGVWAACFIAAATARRGIDFKTLREAVPKKQRRVIDREGYKDFKSLCNAVVSGHDKNSLKAFEPDILGETHFLLLLKEIENGLPDFEDRLPALIAANSSDFTDKRYSQFIAFTTRLARNLSNDDQEDADIKEYWSLLNQFLSPKKFATSSAYKWATSTTCFELYLIVKNKEQNELADKFLNRLDGEDLYHPPEGQIEARDIWLSIQYFGLRGKEKEAVLRSLITLLELWDSAQGRDYTALMLSLVAKNSTIANYLIDLGADLHAVSNNNKWTALMFACRHDQETVALRLVEKETKLDAQNKDGLTALMFACRHAQETVALRLVEKEANLDAQEKDGWTALMLACRYDQKTVALKLVEKEANLGAQDKDGWTALMLACRYDQKTVALRLVEKEAKLNAQKKDGWTALMFACGYDQETVALTLVEKEANLNAQSKEGWTSLMLACVSDQKAVALKLVEKEANLNAQDKEGLTTLMYACRYDQETVALKLVEKNVGINCKNTVGQTILMFAVTFNLKNVVRGLLDKKVSMNDIFESDGITFTALGIARKLGRHEIIKMLEAKEALEIPPYL